MALLPSLPDSARVWLFAASGPVPPSVLDAVRAFLPAWASHGRPVTAEATILADHVIAVAALISPADLNAGVSGCGIDAMSHAVEAALSDADLTLASPLAVTYRGARGAWTTVARPVFRRLARDGAVDGETLVLDLTPTDLGALRASGVERPAAAAWHGRAFRLGVTA